jgi:hypothetical protein
MHFFVLYAAQAIFYVLYHFEIPFFEKFKAIEEPWPWNQNKEEWHKLCWKTFWLTLFNGASLILLNIP